MNTKSESKHGLFLKCAKGEKHANCRCSYNLKKECPGADQAPQRTHGV